MNMTVLDRYIARQFLLGMVPVVLLLLILFSFMALAEELEDVGQGSFTTFDAFRVVVYTSPRRMVDMMPVTMLLGGLLGLGGMANHNELLAARAAGMSRRRIARPVLVMGIGVTLAVGAIQWLAVPKAERQAIEVRARTLQDIGVDPSGDVEFWTRSGDHFVRVNEVLHGQLLTDLEVYTIDDQGRVLQLVQARHAALAEADDWRLDDVTVTSLAGAQVREEHFETMLWPGLLSSRQAAILMRPLESLSLWDLVRLIAILRANGLNDSQHRIVLWQQLSVPVVMLGMALLAVPLLLGSVRRISAGTRIVIGGAIGIGFYLLQQVASHLAGLFALSPPLLIMTPAVLLLAVSVYAQFLDWRR